MQDFQVVARYRHYKITTQRVGDTTYKTIQSRRTIPYGPPATKKEALVGLVFVAVIGLVVGVFYLTAVQRADLHRRPSLSST